MKKYINKVICADCLEVMRQMPDKCVDAVITDPPWNMNYFEDDNKNWEEYRQDIKMWLKEFDRISSQGIIVFQSTKAIPYTAQMFTGYGCFASVKNFSQMTPKSLPNCWDIAFYKILTGYTGTGRNWFLSNTAGMLKERTGHPTPRAEDVMKYIIQLFDWNLILDPFLGSGTTAVAAKELGRRFIGIEKEQKYCDIANRRLMQEYLF